MARLASEVSTRDLKSLDYAALGLSHLIEPAEQPDAQQHDDRQQQQRAAVRILAARTQERGELALPVLQTLVEIRTGLSGPPPPLIVRTAWLIPDHKGLLRFFSAAWLR
jgi:hypothetical protein